VLSGAVLGWRTKYLRQQSQKRLLRNLAIVFVVVLAVFYVAERFRDAQLTKDRKTLEQIAALQQANLSLKNQNSSKSAETLKQTERLYQTLGDVSGQVATLRQLADQYRAAGKYKQAVQTYDRAATLLEKIAQPLEAARVRTSAATAAQQGGDLETARERWTSAKATQHRLGDLEGEKKSALGLASVDAARRERTKQSQVQSPQPKFDEGCSADTLNGSWEEVNPLDGDKRGRRWTFKVSVGDEGWRILRGKADDGSVSGEWLWQYGAFHGGLSWVNGESTPDVVLAPASNCNRINTTQTTLAFVRIK